jgi:hypothetical protein
MFLADSHPPIIHWSQITGSISQPLANCMNIARMWVGQTTDSAEFVRGVIQQEMHKIFENVSTTRPILPDAADSKS